MTKTQLLLAMAALGLAALWHYRAPKLQLDATSKPEMQTQAQAQEDFARLRAEVTSLRRSLSAAQLNQARSAEEPDDEVATGRAEEVVVEPNRHAAKSYGTSEEVVDNLEQRFQSEGGAGGALHRLMGAADRDLRRALAAGSRLESLSCKQTLCKAALSHDNFEVLRSYTENYAHGANEWPGANFIGLEGESGNGPVRSVIFFAESAEQLMAAAQPAEE